MSDASVLAAGTGSCELQPGSGDGSSGEVFGGAVESISTVAPEAVTLLAWARELGIEIEAAKEVHTMNATEP